MATSTIKIINQGFRTLGEAPISSLTEDNRRARIANEQFPQTLDYMLAIQNWAFAMKKQELVKVLPVPVFGWLHKYSFPTDFIRLYSNDADIPSKRPRGNFGSSVFPYEIIGSTVETDEEEIFMTYIKRVTDMNELRPLFVTALADRFAFDVAYAITGNETKSQEVFRIHRQSLKIARAHDGRERGIHKPASRTITSRFGYGVVVN